jgi:hypothetical protein
LQKKHQEAASAARDALPLAAVAADAAGA